MIFHKGEGHTEVDGGQGEGRRARGAEGVDAGCIHAPLHTVTSVTTYCKRELIATEHTE